MGYVYLIHFERPVGNARHYIGYTESFEQRIESHRAGTGSALCKIANEKGINWLVVRVWHDATRQDEVRIKKSTAKHICPICKFKDYDLKQRDKARLGQVERGSLQASGAIKGNQASLS